jgi:hypothetical protein
MEFRPVRTARAPFYSTMYPRFTSFTVVRWPSAVVINAITSQVPGRALHVAELSGPEPVLVRSIGGGDPARHLFLTRLLAPPVAGRFWAADRAWYRLQQWDTAGNRTDAFRRDASWFPDFVQGGPIFGRNTPPISQIDALTQDRRGRIWVFISVAAPNWKQLYDAACAGPAFCPPPPGLTVNRVEVIDPARGLIARSPSRNVIAPLPGGRLVAYSEEGLIPRIEILRFELVER